MSSRPEISVIIPAYNEEKYIGHVFDGLKKQTFKDFETIVADNNSTDRTSKMAKKFGAKVVLEKKKGISYARNAGASAAKGKLLVFLDADTKPSPGLLEAYHKGMDASMVAATGPILPLEKVKASVMIGYKFVSITFVKLAIALGSSFVIGSNFAVDTSVFKKVGGFDVHLATYEDIDLSLRLKKIGKIGYLDDALVYTSARRVEEWGISGFFSYHVANIIRYNLFKKPQEEYDIIR